MAIPRLPSYPMPVATDLPACRVNWPLQPDKAVLLIHDMQQYFISFYAADSELIQQLIRNIVLLKQYCRQHGIPVVYTAQPDQQSPQDRALLNDMWGPGLNNHPQLQHIVTELTPAADDIVLTKWRYSAFQRSPLQQMMQELQRDQLIICGIYGHIGVLMTACDAFMRDIKPFLVADAIADFSAADHTMTLNYVANRCGMLLSSQYFTQQLATQGDTTLLTAESLTQHILSLIDEDEQQFDPDESLIDYGIDSVQIMAIIAKWREQGIETSFVELAKTPTLNGWLALLQQKQGAAA